MVIQELSSIRNNKYVTVLLTYEEARDIANGLYYACEDKPEYKNIKDKCKFLFDMVKHGMIQPETVMGMSKDIKEDCDE